MTYSRQYFRFPSKILQRQMEGLHFGNSGYPMLLFPTDQGRFFDPEDRGLIDCLRQHLERGYLQVFCLETLDWETFLAADLDLQQRRQRWLALERHWCEEFIPYACQMAQNDFLVIAGCSLGATHALNLALRHPRLVRRCLAIAGPYDLANTPALFAEFTQAEREQELYFISPLAYMANMRRERWQELGGDQTQIKLLTAHGDPFLGDHLRLAELLGRLGIHHQLEIWPGGHDWPVWRAQIAAFA